MSSKPFFKKLLITRLSAHGDVIQTLPLLAALKNHPDPPFVGWVVEESAAPLLMNHPLIDRLHISRRKTWIRTLIQKPWQALSLLKQSVNFFRDIRQEQYEASLDAQGLSKSALIPFLSQIPRRFGYKNTRENASIYYTECLPYHDLHNPNLPTVIKFREFAETLGYLKTNTLESMNAQSYPIPPSSDSTKEKIQQLLTPLNPQWPTVAIAPKTIWPSKHWPKTHWQTLLKSLSELPINVLILGAPNEENDIQTLLSGIENDSNLHNLCGKTQLAELYALFQCVTVFIGLDSALFHIANAVAFNHSRQMPWIIGLYGPTAPRRTGPVSRPKAPNPHQVLSLNHACQPCFKRICPLKLNESPYQCMNDLTPEHVLQTLLPLITAHSIQKEASQ